MTQTLTPAAVVADAYAAFGAGDIPRFLDYLAEDVRWDAWRDNFAQRADAPPLRERRGREDVADFFNYLGTCTMVHFAVLDVLASGTQAIAQVEIEVVFPEGGRHRDEELHLWTFGPDGKVVAFRHYVDTAKIIAACRGEDTTQR